MFLELIGLVAIPVVAVVGTVMMMGSDFFQLITLRMDFSRFFGDLIHVFLFWVIMALLFVVDIVMLVMGAFAMIV
ncbi:hypothetical protein JKG47_17915 [Acidithiobacillus sp. MC6.1]|nr:hypothetical protein [Acidithiobacillus sp. MC6.1]